MPPPPKDIVASVSTSDAAAPKPLCRRCDAAESRSWQRASDGDGQVCFNCFETAANRTTATDEAGAAKEETTDEKAPAAAAAVTSLVDDAADAAATQIKTEAVDDSDRPPADDQRQRLRKSTRSTRYKSKAAIAASTSAGATSVQSSAAAAASATSATAAAGTPIPSGSGSVAQTPSSSLSSSVPASGGGGGAPTTSGNGGGGGKAPKGRSRRGALFKRHPPSRAPTVTATTRSVQHCFHRGTYMQVGDIVSLCDHSGDVYYAQVRGLLVDSFCEKSAYLTWLLPTRSSPPPNERFDASTYLIGPDEDSPRRLDCVDFVMHAPSGYYHSREEPYPAPDCADNAGGTGRGFIWTSLAEVAAPSAAARRGFGSDGQQAPGGGVVVVG